VRNLFFSRPPPHTKINHAIGKRPGVRKNLSPRKLSGKEVKEREFCTKKWEGKWQGAFELLPTQQEPFYVWVSL
jgi:hypothetical protein